MKLLIACEESQAVCIEFRKLGHEAYSCDIQPESGGYPEWHIKGDVLEQLDKGWDMMIAFPPCTFLTSANTYIKRGCSKYTPEQAKTYQQQAINFFMAFAKSDCWKKCIENPVGIMSTHYRKPDQIIQPWMFGEDASKKTCLWLKGLPPLKPTNIITKERYANQTPSGQNKLGPSPDRAKLRAKTYPGIAKAMAEQWGN